jgi:hypothetical protein
MSGAPHLYYLPLFDDLSPSKCQVTSMLGLFEAYAVCK